MEKDPFKEYLRESEPDKAHKGYVWSTAIGLQAVDGLKPSKYLVDTAIQNIEGKITMKEAQSLIDSYYKEDQFIYQMMSVLKKRIRFLHVLRKFFLKQLLHFLRMNISLYIVNSFREFTNMLERLEITILQRMNGYLTGQRLCMVVPLN
jgi:hypothetical protein